MNKQEFVDELSMYEREYLLYHGLQWDTRVEIEDLLEWLKNDVDRELNKWSAG